MARTRMIKPEVFKDTDFAELSFSARLFYIALPGIADKEGRMVDDPKRIKTDTLPYDEVNVNELLEELTLGGFLIRYEVDGKKYIQMTRWQLEQKPNPKEAASLIPSFDGVGKEQEKQVEAIESYPQEEEAPIELTHRNEVVGGLAQQDNQDFHGCSKGQGIML